METSGVDCGASSSFGHNPETANLTSNSQQSVVIDQQSTKSTVSTSEERDQGTLSHLPRESGGKESTTRLN